MDGRGGGETGKVNGIAPKDLSSRAHIAWVQQCPHMAISSPFTLRMIKTKWSFGMVLAFGDYGIFSRQK